jgi:hypothetical protein
MGVKRPGREADNSPPSSAEVKNGRAIPPPLDVLTVLPPSLTYQLLLSLYFDTDPKENISRAKNSILIVKDNRRQIDILLNSLYIQLIWCGNILFSPVRLLTCFSC